MKKNLIIILTILPFSLFGQHLEFCKTKKDVETYLSGKWKITDSDSEYIHHYWFKDGQGNVKYYEPVVHGVERIISGNHSFVDIIKYDNGFKLKYTYLYGKYVSKLKYLDSKKLILITEGKEKEYYKIAE